MSKRKASPEWIARVWAEKKSIAAVAQRIGYSYVGAARALRRVAGVSTKTSLSK